MSARVTYRIDHDTRYVHDGLASTSQHVACLKPRTLDRQRVAWHDLTIDPAPAAIRERIDYFGNPVNQFAILAPYTEMRVPESKRGGTAGTERRSTLDAALPGSRFGSRCSTAAARRFRPRPSSAIRRRTAPAGAELDSFARGFFEPGRPLLAAAIDLMHGIHDGFTFDPAATTVATPVTECSRSDAASARTSHTCSSRLFGLSGCRFAT